MGGAYLDVWWRPLFSLTPGTFGPDSWPSAYRFDLLPNVFMSVERASNWPRLTPVRHGSEPLSRRARALARASSLAAASISSGGIQAGALAFWRHLALSSAARQMGGAALRKAIQAESAAAAELLSLCSLLAADAVPVGAAGLCDILNYSEVLCFPCRNVSVVAFHRY